MFDPIVNSYAHRGLWDATRPENSLAAFHAAIVAGVGVELDVRLSADGVAMVFHDQMLDRMTNASGWMHARTAHELVKLKLPGGEPLPRLRDALTLIGDAAPILIELKADAGSPDALVEAVADDLTHHSGPAAIMSFTDEALAAAIDAEIECPIGLLIAPQSDRAHDVLEDRIGLARSLGCDFLGPHYSLINALETQLPMVSWTIDTPAALDALSPAGRRVAAPIFERVAPCALR